jgi:hypothetical protein
MNIKHLRVTNLRGFEQAEFQFTPGVNLLVGINGMGKSTVLDALRISFSRILPKVTSSRGKSLPFVADDIRVLASALTIQLAFCLDNRDFEFVVHKQREASVPHKDGVVREQTISTPDKESCTPDLSVLGDLKMSRRQPICLFFSTRRSLVSDATPSSFAATGQASAFTDALTSRELRLSEFAYWIRAQETIAHEEPIAKKHLMSLRRVAKRFVPYCQNLRVTKSEKPSLEIDKNGQTLDLRQLSDGERGVFALVLDLTRRLSQANPGLSDPVKSGEAIVLIDELDLHLHPRWQSMVVERLAKTFPKCQFICTTHSPQIIGAVEPEQILLLTDLGVTRPDRSLGMDSNWILRHLMEAEDRPASATAAIREAEAFINEGNFKRARLTIAQARKDGLDLPEWSILDGRMARLEALAE